VAQIYRPARLGDGSELLELRHSSILALAIPAMPEADVLAWANRLSPVGMLQKLSTLEIWVAESGGEILGWVALSGDRLEGLYTRPASAGTGVGSGLLHMAEKLMWERRIPTMRLEASANAIGFYLRRGFEPVAPRLAIGAQELEKTLGLA
jgi:putative acetyltransferase